MNRNTIVWMMMVMMMKVMMGKLEIKYEGTNEEREKNRSAKVKTHDLPQTRHLKYCFGFSGFAGGGGACSSTVFAGSSGTEISALALTGSIVGQSFF